MNSRTVWVGLAAALWTSGCSCESERDSGKDASNVDGQVSLDASPMDARADARRDANYEAGSREEFCEGNAPLMIERVGGGESICTGSLATITFRNGLCSCDGLVSNGGVVVDGFNSTSGQQQRGVGSVGTNGNYQSTSGPTIGGSLLASGTVTYGTAGMIGLDAWSGGDYGGSGSVTRNLSSGGNVTFDSRGATIGGIVTLPQDRTFRGPDGVSAVRAPVAAPIPCDCDPAQRLDIQSIVERYRTNNDNSVAGIVGGNGTYQVPQNLPCGRYFFDSIVGNQGIVLRTSSRIAVFIAGDVQVTSGFGIEVEGNGQVDLFVGGSVRSTGELNFGSRTHPSAVRLYIAGSDGMRSTSGGIVGGNLYIPNGPLSSTREFEVFGAIFAKSVSTNEGVVVHYDSSVLNLADECGSPVGSQCTSCRDCDNQACIGGTCGACRTSADCCSPLECNTQTGVCELVIL